MTEQTTTTPVKYPPLRVMLTADKPTLAWQQVLTTYPLAERQPHLYLLGHYSIWHVRNMNTTEIPYIKMELIESIEDAGGDRVPYYLVFMIDEVE